MSERDEQAEVVKWYTRARRFPQLIGKTPDGARIWGGPYTYTQVIASVSILVVGTKTISIWGQFGLVTDALLLLGVAYGTALVIGRLPIGARNPLAVAAGLLRALNAPGGGTFAGSPVHLRRPHRAPSRVVITPTASRRVTRDATGPRDKNGATSSPAPAHAPRPPASSPSRPATAPNTRGNGGTHPSPPRAAPALSGVQRLLAASTAHTEGD